MSELKLSQHVAAQGNTLVVGGGGSGKGQYLMLPNLLSCDTSFIVYDVMGEYYRSTKEQLEERGYQVDVISLHPGFVSNCHYDPFTYIHNAEDICAVAKALFPFDQKSDRFFIETSRKLLELLIAYVRMMEKQPSFAKFLNTIQEIFSCEKEPFLLLDEKFKALAEAYGEAHIVFRSWKYLCQNTGIAKHEVLMDMYMLFQTDLVESDMITRLTQADTLALDTFTEGDQKRALFLITGCQNIHWLPTLLLTQFTNMQRRLQVKPAGRECYLFLDEFQNIRHIPEFSRFLLVCEAYRINTVLALQSLDQLRMIYGDCAAQEMLESMKAIVFMGSREFDICEYFSQLAGERTRRRFPRFWRLERCRILSVAQLAGLAMEQCYVFLVNDGVYLDGKLMIGKNIPLKKVGGNRLKKNKAVEGGDGNE